MSPADDALDALARELRVPPPDPARLEQMRTEILAAAGTITPQRPRSFGARGVVTVALAAVAIAAAVVLSLRIAAPPAGDRAWRASIAAAPGTELVRVSAPPDEVVHLRHGQLAIEVSRLGAAERFRVTTDDAELEVRGTRFFVAADRGRLRSVDVTAGVVELRLRAGGTRTLKAGERWTARDDEQTAMAPAAPADAPPAVAAVSEPPPATRAPAPARRSRPASRPSSASPAATSPQRVVEPEPATRSSPEPAAAPLPAAPGEREFRAGWDALKRGEPARAADSFAASRRIAGRGAIGEDAAYWEGVALARAGRNDAAVRALRTFLSAYPRSARAGEAAARLGWLLVDQGDLAEAERWFQSAADDPVPSVRNSARSGLARVKAPGR